QARQLLAPRLDEGADVADLDRLFAKIICWAEEALKHPPESSGPTLAQVVRARVPQAFAFQFRTARGAWSAARKGEVSRADFLGHCPSELLDACAVASDAPARRPDLLDRIRCELQVLWSDHMGALPLAHAAQLSGESAEAAALEFRKALERIWKAAC